MLRPLSDFPVVPVGDFHVVKVCEWEKHFGNGSAIRHNGKPVRPECRDLWIITSDAGDAHEMAMLVQRYFLPKDPAGSRERVVTTRRAPTFAGMIDDIPGDVAYYFSASRVVDDQALIQRRLPAPARVNEQITWSGSEYEIRSGHGHFREKIAPAPTLFAKRLAEARANLLAAVGPGFDASIDHLNASPVLAALLPCLTRPAAEAVAHWMKGLGRTEQDSLVIPPRGMKVDLPVHSLMFQSVGVNLHASFMLNLGDVRITDYGVSGLRLTDTVATALDAGARNGTLLLSQVIDLPGSELIPVIAVERAGQRWNLRLLPTSVAIEPPSSDIPFDAGAEIDRIAEEGSSIQSDAAMLLRQLGKERSDFILYCVEDGNSGMSFDVSAWTPSDLPMEIQLRERMFKISSRHCLPIHHIFGS